MMRSLYSGVSGLKAHQTKMDVIGNNIANVNTIGFKASSVRFSDVYYQTSQAASGPNAETGKGGTNALQVGLGVGLGSISTSVSVSGGAERTDNTLDMMINGDSFFIVNDGGTNYFTKAGNFAVDANGDLCTSSGALVMGWQVDPQDPTKSIQDAVSPLKIMSSDKLYSSPEATTEVYVAGNIDQNDPQMVKGKNVIVSFYDSLGNKYNAKLSIQQSEDNKSAYSVSLSDVLDSNGESIFAKIDPDTGKYTASEVTLSLGGLPYDVAVNEETGEVSLTGASSALKFNSETGKFESVTGEAADDGNTKKLALSINAGDGTNPFRDVNIDFSSLTMYSTSGKTSLESGMGDLDGLGAGKQVGNMTGVAVDTSGKVYGKYDNGDSILLGQIAVASFANPAGLEAVGNNMFAATLNSGTFDGIGKDPTAGGGSLSTGVLEMSNVDLSQQFTEMIVTQRGFQANSRIITTSDSLLEELINLKR